MFQGLRGTISGRRLRRRMNAAQPPEDKSTPAASSSAEEMICDICCEVTHDPLVQPCQQCPNSYCTTCISDLFKKAIHERSMMPPTCCGMIPLHFGLPHLSEEDAEAYRERFNEIVMFKEGFYCANSTCSRFISGASIDEAQRQPGASDASAKTPMSIASKHDSLFSNTDKPAEVTCTNCGAQSCISCQALAHPGNECKHGHNDERELEAQLSAWGYKRCPRCRNGVRRMYGCSHMQCGWCAFHFCWYCMSSFTDCENNGCDGQSEVQYDEDGYTDDDDDGDDNDDGDEVDDDAEVAETEVEGGPDTPEPQTVSAVEATSGSIAGSDAQDLQRTAENEALLRELVDYDLLMGPDPHVGHSGAEIPQAQTTPEQTDGQGMTPLVRSAFVARVRRLLQRLRASRPGITGGEIVRELLDRLRAENAVDRTTVANQGEDPPLEHSASLNRHETGVQATNSAAGERIIREANLDGRSPGHWMDSGLDFGEEPGGSRTAVASCGHKFIHVERKISTKTPWKEMQCHRCWKVIQPTIRERKFTLASADRAAHANEDAGDNEDEDIEEEGRVNASGKMKLIAGLSLPRRNRALKAMECRGCGFVACHQCAERMRARVEDQD